MVVRLEEEGEREKVVHPKGEMRGGGGVVEPGGLVLV